MTVRLSDRTLEDWIKGMPRVFIPDMVKVKVAWDALPDSEEAQDEFLQTQDKKFGKIEKV